MTENEQSDDLDVPHGPFVMLEHVNICVGNQWTEELESFYFRALRAARDPRASEITASCKKNGCSFHRLVWANIGLQQLHLPIEDKTVSAQILRGTVGLQWPAEALEGLRKRLVASGIPVTQVDGGNDWSSFEFHCPKGNTFRVRAAEKKSFIGPQSFIDSEKCEGLPGGPGEGLGIEYVAMICPRDSARKIGNFYKTVFGATVSENSRITREGDILSDVIVHVGSNQFLRFEESPLEEIPAYDGHHIALYTNSFETLYEKAKGMGLIFNNPRFPNLRYDTITDAVRLNEFRIKDICDPETGEFLYSLEHEIRSIRHPGFEATLRCLCQQ